MAISDYGVTPPIRFPYLDMDDTAKNWRSSKKIQSRQCGNVQTQVRMTNRVGATHALSQAFNYLGSQCGRVIFSKVWPMANRPTTGTDTVPLCRWYYDDNVKNYRRVQFNALEISRTSDPGTNTEALLQRTDSAGSLDTDTKGPSYTVVDANADFQSAKESIFTYERGDVPGTPEHDEGIAAIKGASPIGVVYQALPMDVLNYANHDYTVMHQLTAPGDPILAYFERIRSVFHELRSTNLPIWTWAADKQGGSYGTAQTANTGDETGIHIQGTTPTNIFDFASTSRSATSPGFICHVSRFGVGPTTKEDGKKLRVRCAVYASHSGSNDGTISFEGSDTFSSNTASITVTAGAGAQWWGGSSDYVFLDTSLDNDDSSSARSKVDVLADSGDAADSLYIYAIALWGEYGL